VRRTQMVEIELSDGEVINAEISTPAGGDVAWSRQRYQAASFNADLSRIGRWLVGELRAAFPNPPERVGVEFGLKLGVKSGPLVAVLAEASGEASVVVRLEWTAAGSQP